MWATHSRVLIYFNRFTYDVFLESDAIACKDLSTPYVRDRMLLGAARGIPFSATRDWAWCQHCVVAEREFRSGYGFSAH